MAIVNDYAIIRQRRMNFRFSVNIAVCRAW